MANSNATSPKPSGSGAGQNSEGVRQHKRMAQGFVPSTSGPKTPA